MTSIDRLSGLDALRALAALLVAAYHGVILTGGEPHLLARAYLMVDLFFMLSGFVLARSYEHRFAEIGKLSFIWLRTKRLWFPVSIGVALGVFVRWVLGHDDEVTWTAVALAFTLLPQSDGKFLFNVPAWSILFELLANMVHVLVLRHLPTRWLALLVAIDWAIVASLLHDGQFDMWGQEATFWHGLPRLFLSYGAGILLWRVNGDRPLSLPPWLIIGAAGMALACSQISGVSESTIIVALFPLVIVLAANVSAGRFARIAGAFSFPLYAVHWPILEASAAWGFGPALTLSLLATLTIGVAADRRCRSALRGALAISDAGETRTRQTVAKGLRAPDFGNRYSDQEVLPRVTSWPG